MKSKPLIGVLVVLLVFSVLGFVHAARALFAESIYALTRYGSHEELTPAEICDKCETAYRLYPYNFYFCVWAGKSAFYGRDGVGDVEDVELLVAAGKWAGIAYNLNPFNSEAVHLQAEVKSLVDIDEAISIWEDYRDWHFWEPFNHWMMFDLYMRAGRLEQAEETLYWLQQTEYVDRAEAMLVSAWRRRQSENR